MNDMDREKILDKIQKCLRLSKSSEAHEAAAALRQAQKLMELHNVSPEELLGMEVKSTQVLTPEPYKKKKFPAYLTHLVNIIQIAFNVQALIEPGYRNGRPRVCLRYFGINGKDQLAAYAHEVMWRQLSESWRVYQKENPWVVGEKGARQGFWLGWLREVRSKVMEFAGTDEEKEMLTKALTNHADGKVHEMKSNTMSVSGETMSAGRNAASDFSIHRPMNGAKQRALSHNAK